MLNLPHPQQGVSLIELMVGLVIMSILLSIGVPSFKSWIQNAQIRASTEAILNGLQLARGEAVRRNVTVNFQLTDTNTNACILSTSGKNWVVSQDNPAGACASAPSDTIPPRIIQSRSSAEGSPNAAVAATEVVTATGVVAAIPIFNGTVTFNSLGRVVTTGAIASVAAGNQINIDVSNPTGGACAPAGQMNCMRIIVSPGGQVRMCDPARQRATDPRGC